MRRTPRALRPAAPRMGKYPRAIRPRRTLGPCTPQRHCGAFVPSFPVEALDGAVLDRLAGCDVMQAHTVLLGPAQHPATGRFRSEVGLGRHTLAAEIGISETTLYSWRAKYGALEVSDLRRLRELEDENRRLKKIVADQVLNIEIEALKIVAEGNF
jgi:putative transposase